MDSSWQDQAACRGMDVELFYADDPAQASQALLICRGCPVREPCLNTAMAREEFDGIWGATAEAYRRRIIRREARARRKQSRAA